MCLVRAHPKGFLVYFFPLCSLVVGFFFGRTGSVQLFTYIQCPLSLLVFVITMINFIHCGFRSRSRRLIENVRTQFKIKIEVSSCSLYLLVPLMVFLEFALFCIILYWFHISVCIIYLYSALRILLLHDCGQLEL